MARWLASIPRKEYAKHARKRDWSVPAWLGHRPARLLSLAGVAVLAPLFIVAPFGNAAVSPSNVRIGKVALLPPGTTTIGPAAVSAPLTLDVVLTPQNPTALTGFIDELYDPASTEYHHFLAAGQFGSEFGATQSTIQSVSSALTSLGFTPGRVTPNDLTIPVSTTVAKAEAALSVQIDSYSVPGGRTAYANTSAPEVPASVASNVTNILGLSNVAQASSSFGEVAPGSARPSPASSVVPASGGPTACAAATDKGATANELAHAYGFDTGAYSGGRLGAGETIALAEVEPFESSDIATYEACYGVTTTVNTTNVDGGPGTGYGSGEASSDIEDIAGLAPDATIDVYQAPNTLADLYDVYNAIAMSDTAQVVSSSWGNCESDNGASFAESEELIFQEMATQGQTMVADSADSGSTDCYYHGAGSDELNVADVASDPYVTGVGGTQLTSFGPPPTEAVWNDQYGAGGGGISEIWQMPTYQQALGINADSNGTPCGAPLGDYCREVPDVSAMAGSPYYAFYHDGSWGGWYGTSFATPLWGSLTVLADEGCSEPAGFLNPALYTHSGDMNDITSGNNDDTASGYTGDLYPATTGYDMASGLGSPAAALFAPGVLCTASTTAPTVTLVTPSSGPTTGGTKVTITGTNFTGATKVLFGAVAATSFTVVSSNGITAVAPAQAAATHGIYVTTPQGTSAAVAADQFTYVSPPTTAVLVPANGATVSGSTTTLDASGTNATSVQFWLLGGSYGYTGKLLCTATLTYYGWLCSWNTTTVPNGSYALVSKATNTNGSVYSAGVNITVKN
jgi:subtilase family serine protease